MNRFSPIFGLIVIILWGAAIVLWGFILLVDSPQEIPLDQIWADYTLGTRDILKLEPEVFSSEASKLPPDVHAQRARESLINQIGAKFQSAPKEKPGPVQRPKPRPAFAVLGTGREALEAAAAVLAHGQQPQHSFPAGSEMSIVFFSYQAGSRVELVKVERRGETFEVHYRFFADGLTMSTSHLALIPLGSLPPGKYRVEIIQAPMSGRFPHSETGQIMEDWARQLVCQPFSFSIVQQVK